MLRVSADTFTTEIKEYVQRKFLIITILIDNSIIEGVQTLEETASKWKYICKVCGESGHNARNKAKCSKQC